MKLAASLEIGLAVGHFSGMQLPTSPRLFLIDGYALVYRAFFALISRPLTTSRGENTSAAWGISTFLQRLFADHRPDYLGWVNDSGLSFRHERYPAYKATRQKLTEELQADFDRGMERIRELLAAYRIPVLAVDGYEADDVIGTLAAQGVRGGFNVVIISGDKDFHQLVRPGVWLLNPGRGGAAAVEEQWVSPENAGERFGVPPQYVVDYLALVGDSSDNVPGVPGIGDKTARELVTEFGSLEEILRNAGSLSKKRPREALLAHPDRALLSKELVTIRDDLPIALDPEPLHVRDPDRDRLRELFVELEFHTLAKDLAPAGASGLRPGSVAVSAAAPVRNYITVDTIELFEKVMVKARAARQITVAVEALSDPSTLEPAPPLRSTIIGIGMGLAPAEAYYFPLAHRLPEPKQGDLLIDASVPNVRDDSGAAVRGPASSQSMVVTASGVVKRKRTPARSANEGSIASSLLARGTQPVRNLPSISGPEMAPLRRLLEDPLVPKTLQNAKYDLLVLRRAGITLRGIDFDTMLASYVLDPGRRSHDLDVLALEFLDRKMTSQEELCGKGKNAIPFDQCPIDAARDYSCADADVTLQLRRLFEPQLATYDLFRLLREIEVPLTSVLAEMEWHGVAIDVEWFRSLKDRFQRERELVEQRIYQVAGVEFNINSNPQLREILFTRLQLPVIKRTATGPSTDASVLQELAEQGHDLPGLLMEYRELAKLESTYLDALPALVHPETRRLHTSFNQTVATTGRLSSSDPNLQNIPIRRELGRDIRRGFVPEAGWVLLSADYSQIELRLLAHLSGDQAFVEAFRAGGDIHRQTASVIFDVPVDQVTAEMRGRAKTINFATIYGQGPHALSRQLHIDYAEARDFIARYFERFQGIRQYLDSMVEFARQNGYVQTLFGRRRYIPELRDRNFNVRAFGERTATNSPIQGSAADLIKLAMIAVDRRLRDGSFRSRMLLQVHDELVFEAPVVELDVLRTLVRTEMENAAQLSVPLVVDIGTGGNWLEAKTA